MVPLTDLILPILIATVCVFFASSIMWMLLPHHKADIKFLEDKESGYIEAIKSLGIKPGLYMYPGCDHSKGKSDERKNEIKERWDAGPWGMLTVYPGKPSFGMNLVKTFIIYLVISIFVAYITGIGTRPGAQYMEVFRVAGTTAILGYCMGSLCGDVFMGKPTRFMVTSFIDGVIYALITAGVMASMWPAAQSALDGMLLPPGVN